MLQAELLDQYFQFSSSINAYEKRLKEDCVKGCLTEKTIKGKKYWYLQWRDNEKIRSKYVKPDELKAIQSKIEVRKEYEKSIRRLKRSVIDIEKFLGRDLIDEYARENNRLSV